jgi:hypothetical protein
MNDGPTLKFGKYAGVALPAVPGAYLEFLAKKPDLWPDTRGQIEAELQRRGSVAAPTDASDALTPARALLARKPPPKEEDEPLDARLRGDEERVVPIRCPRCGHDVDCFVRLVRK